MNMDQENRHTSPYQFCTQMISVAIAEHAVLSVEISLDGLPALQELETTDIHWSGTLRSSTLRALWAYEYMDNSLPFSMTLENLLGLRDLRLRCPLLDSEVISMSDKLLKCVRSLCTVTPSLVIHGRMSSCVQRDCQAEYESKARTWWICPKTL